MVLSEGVQGGRDIGIIWLFIVLGMVVVWMVG
jgi:hypothetical protein